MPSRIRAGRRPRLIIAGESDEHITEMRVVAHLTTVDKPATALVVSNNQMTLGTMRAIRQCRLRVPRDIAMICYDDFEWADLFEPRITAMARTRPHWPQRRWTCYWPGSRTRTAAADHCRPDGVQAPRLLWLRTPKVPGGHR